LHACECKVRCKPPHRQLDTSCWWGPWRQSLLRWLQHCCSMPTRAWPITVAAAPALPPCQAPAGGCKAAKRMTAVTVGQLQLAAPCMVVAFQIPAALLQTGYNGFWGRIWLCSTSWDAAVVHYTAGCLCTACKHHRLTGRLSFCSSELLKSSMWHEQLLYNCFLSSMWCSRTMHLQQLLPLLLWLLCQLLMCQLSRA
jgi:hypothetical protein